MQVQTLFPEYPLNQAIDFFWHCSAPNFNSRRITLPLLHQELVINLSDLFYTKTQNGKLCTRGQDNWVMGLQREQLWSETAGRHESLGIFFKPHGLFQLFGLHAADLHTQTLCLQDIFLADSLALLDQLRAPRTASNKLIVLQEFINRKAKIRQLKPALANLFNELAEEPLQRGNLKRFMAGQPTSAKSFLSDFKTVYGYTPKKLLHLRQINAALRAIASRPQQPLTAVALEHGFYDQAHFTRTFQTYTSLNPKQYQQMVKQGRISPVSPNDFAVG